MDKIMTIGLDLAKNVFHVVCCKHGKIVRKKLVRRSQVKEANASNTEEPGDAVIPHVRDYTGGAG